MDGPSIYSPANKQLANDIIENKQVQTTAFDAEDCVLNAMNFERTFP